MGVDSEWFLPSGKGRRPPEPCCAVWKLVICWPRGSNSGSPCTIDNNKNKNNTSSWWQPMIFPWKSPFNLHALEVFVENHKCFTRFMVWNFGVFWGVTKISRVLRKTRVKIENFRETRPSRFADSTVLRGERARTQFLSAAPVRAVYSGVLSSVVPMTILLSSATLRGWVASAESFDFASEKSNANEFLWRSSVSLSFWWQRWIRFWQYSQDWTRGFRDLSRAAVVCRVGGEHLRLH